MKFTKMHGIGNDYVYVDCFKERVENPSEVARKISDRHFGIGSDGLILIEPSKLADVKMRMFNADGGESEMCGNGIRCVAKYAFDHGLSKSNPMKIETGRGVLSLELKLSDGKVTDVVVNMGTPEFGDMEKVGVRVEFLGEEWNRAYPILDQNNEKLADAIFVSMGNPHAVIFVEDAAAVDVATLGPLIERHRAFPNRINVHWVQVQSKNEVTMRTWERGSGITLACGTGAAAVCVAGAVIGPKTNDKILAHLPGGDLQLEWREDDDCVYMTGPAVEVFSGEWNE